MQDEPGRREHVVIGSTPWPCLRIIRYTFNNSLPRVHPRLITSEPLRFQSRCQCFLRLPEKFYWPPKIENYCSSKLNNEVWPLRLTVRIKKRKGIWNIMWKENQYFVLKVLGKLFSQFNYFFFNSLLHKINEFRKVKWWFWWLNSQLEGEIESLDSHFPFCTSLAP